VQQKGFIGSLFDLSFESLITTRIIRVLYVLILLLIGLGTIGLLINALTSETIAGGGKIVALIVIPIGAFIYVLWSRVALEVVIALFRTMENTGETARLLGEGRGGSGTPPPA